MEQEENNQGMVSLEKVVRNVRVTKLTLQNNIRAGKIRDATLEDGIPLGLCDLLRKQTEERGGSERRPIKNLLPYNEAAYMLGMSRERLDTIIREGIIRDLLHLGEGSFFTYDATERRLRFKDEALLRYEIPAEYSSNGRPFSIGSKLMRKDAIEELGRLLGIFQKKMLELTGEEEGVRFIVPRSMPTECFPIIFYNKDNGIAIKVQEAKTRERVVGLYSGDTPGLGKYDFSGMGVSPKMKIVSWDFDGSYYMISFLQVSIPRIFLEHHKYFPIVIGNPWTNDHLVSRLTWEFRNETAAYTRNQKPLWLDDMVQFYGLYKKRLYLGI